MTSGTDTLIPVASAHSHTFNSYSDVGSSPDVPPLTTQPYVPPMTTLPDISPPTPTRKPRKGGNAKDRKASPSLDDTKFQTIVVPCTDLVFIDAVQKQPSEARVAQVQRGMKAGQPIHASTLGVVKAILIDGKMVVFEGGAQMLARKQLGDTQVLVHLYEFSIDQAIEMRWFDSLNRGPVDQLELMAFVGKYVGWAGRMKKAKAFLGKEKSQVAALKKLSEADPLVIDAIKQGQNFSTSHGLKLMERKGTHPDLDLELWIKRVVEEKLGVKPMKDAIDAHYHIDSEGKPAESAVEVQEIGLSPSEDPVADVRARVTQRLETIGHVTITFRGVTCDVRTLLDKHPMEVEALLNMLAEDDADMPNGPDGDGDGGPVQVEGDGQEVAHLITPTTALDDQPSVDLTVARPDAANDAKQEEQVA